MKKMKKVIVQKEKNQFIFRWKKMIQIKKKSKKVIENQFPRKSMLNEVIK